MRGIWIGGGVEHERHMNRERGGGGGSMRGIWIGRGAGVGGGSPYGSS